MRIRRGYYRQGNEQAIQVNITLTGRLQQISASNEIIKARYPQLCHPFAHLFRHHRHIVDEMLRPTGEFCAQILALRGNASRTGVEMTLTRHIAAQRDEGGSAETKLFRT